MPSLTDNFESLMRDPLSFKTVEEISMHRKKLPKVHAGHPLQGYKWALTMRMRVIRNKGAGKIDRKAVNRMFSDNGDMCPDCGVDMRPWITRKYPTIDHKVSLANGGTNEIENLRVICNSCNSRKGAR